MAYFHLCVMIFHCRITLSAETPIEKRGTNTQAGDKRFKRVSRVPLPLLKLLRRFDILGRSYPSLSQHVWGGLPTSSACPVLLTPLFLSGQGPLISFGNPSGDLFPSHLWLLLGGEWTPSRAARGRHSDACLPISDPPDPSTDLRPWSRQRERGKPLGGGG